MDKEIQFNKEEWKVTYTEVPHIIEGYDASGTILNLTIGKTTIPLMSCGISTGNERLTQYHQMCANATLMAMSPTLFKCAEVNLRLLKSALACFESFYLEYNNDLEVQKQDVSHVLETSMQTIITELKKGISATESALDKATFRNQWPSAENKEQF